MDADAVRRSVPHGGKDHLAVRQVDESANSLVVVVRVLLGTVVVLWGQVLGGYVSKAVDQAADAGHGQSVVVEARVLEVEGFPCLPDVQQFAGDAPRNASTRSVQLGEEGIGGFLDVGEHGGDDGLANLFGVDRVHVDVGVFNNLPCLPDKPLFPSRFRDGASASSLYQQQ